MAEQGMQAQIIDSLQHAQYESNSINELVLRKINYQYTGNKIKLDAVDNFIDSLNQHTSELKDAFYFLAKGQTLLEIQGQIYDSLYLVQNQPVSAAEFARLANIFESQLLSLDPNFVRYKMDKSEATIFVKSAKSGDIKGFDSGTSRNINNSLAVILGNPVVNDIKVDAVLSDFKWDGSNLIARNQEVTSSKFADLLRFNGLNRQIFTMGVGSSNPAKQLVPDVTEDWIKIDVNLERGYNVVISSPTEMSTLTAQVEIGDELRKKVVTFYSYGQNSKILLGLHSGAEKEYTVVPHVWYSNVYERGPIYFKMKTNSNWSSYALELGKAYEIQWNQRERKWDLANVVIKNE